MIAPQNRSFDADTEGLVVRDVSDISARIDIRYLSGYQLVPPRIRVFIDGECAGELEATDQRAQPFLVAPGIHSVSLKYQVWRSETREVNVSAGSKIALRSGFQRDPQPRLYLYIASSAALAASPLFLAGFPFLGLAAIGLASILIADAYWVELTTPGSYLYLRPQAEGPLAESASAGAMQRSPMTILRLMFLIAVIAVVLSVGINTLTWQRRTEIQLKQDQYRWQAKRYADDERRSKRSEAASAELETLWLKRVEHHSELVRIQSELDTQLNEAQRYLHEIRAMRSTHVNPPQSVDRAQIAELDARCLENIEGLSEMIRSRSERSAMDTQLREAKQALTEIQNRRAKDAQSAASAARLKEKYLGAAARPWEPVKDDAPGP